MEELPLSVRLHHGSVGIKAIQDYEIVGLQPARLVVEARNGEVSLPMMLDVAGLPRLELVMIWRVRFGVIMRARLPVGVSTTEKVELPITSASSTRPQPIERLWSEVSSELSSYG